MESTTFLSFSQGQLASQITQTVVWLVIVVACLVAVRRPWAWPGLAGGVLGLGAAVTFATGAVLARRRGHAGR